MVESIIFYICDRNKPCAGSSTCGEYCRHTTDEDHRMNRDPVVPWNNRRFEHVTIADENRVYYIEKEAGK